MFLVFSSLGYLILFLKRLSSHHMPCKLEILSFWDCCQTERAAYFSRRFFSLLLQGTSVTHVEQRERINN